MAPSPDEPVAAAPVDADSGLDDRSHARRISEAILSAYKQHYGRGPESIKVHLTGDTVLALMRGGFSVVEESLRMSGQAQVVRDQRRAFGDMVAPVLSAAITDVIHREVVAVLSDTSQDPDLSAIVLVLASRPR